MHHYRSARFMLALLLVAFSFGNESRASIAAWSPAARALPPVSMWTQYWSVRVRAAPGGAILTELDLDQEVLVTGSTIDSKGMRWARVTLWGALVGWIEMDLLSPGPVPNPPTTGVPVAPHPVGPHAPMPFQAQAIAATRASLRVSPDARARTLRTVPAGTEIAITRWATDSHGRAWYGTSSPAGAWVDAEQVTMLPTKHLADLRPVRGVGMWLTPPVLEIASPDSIVDAALKSHITHLYVEVAGSNGFYGRSTLDRLLPVAHRAHIAVLAWVYPFLDDLPRDVAMSLAAARYVTPTGDRVDGLAADVEQNMQEPYVRAYSQVVRAGLGPRMLMVIATYPL